MTNYLVACVCGLIYMHAVVSCVNHSTDSCAKVSCGEVVVVQSARLCAVVVQGARMCDVVVQGA